MQKIIGGKLYDTDTAHEVASNRYWDGKNWDRSGRNTYLYKTKKGNFFVHNTTLWQGELDDIKELSLIEAKNYYEELSVYAMTWEEAFGESPEEA